MSQKVLLGCGIFLIAGLVGLALLMGVSLAASLPWLTARSVSSGQPGEPASQVEITPVVESVTVLPTPSEPPVTAPTLVPDAQACTPLVTLTAEHDGRVDYNGVYFLLDSALVDSVQAQVCPAVPFDEFNPLAGHPPYVAFFFPSHQPSSLIQAELRVYSVTGDMSAYLYPLNSLGDLQAAVTQQTQPITWFDGTLLHIDRRYEPFYSGMGVRGVVEYAQDYIFYTNNYLQYEFNGLSQDGAYYVEFHYPISAPFLLDIENSDPRTNTNPQAIAIPEWTDDYEAHARIIQAYNEEALRRFGGMADADFSPSLSLLDTLIESMVVSAH